MHPLAPSEVLQFCKHMQQLGLHAGNALVDAKTQVPASCINAVEACTDAARDFYIATRKLELSCQAAMQAEHEQGTLNLPEQRRAPYS